MLLHELLSSRRDEVLEACSAEGLHPQGLDRLARYIADHFDQIVDLLKPESEALGSTLFPSAASSDPLIVGASPAMIRVRIGVEQLSHRSRAAVLILGEPGTGRRHCARALHTATFPEGEFLELDESVELTELERRLAAIRGNAASASGMTVYVRDIAGAADGLQRHVADLLRAPFLQCRLVVSSSHLLSKTCRPGKLLPELATGFVSKLNLPPLNERTCDIGPLAARFAAQLAAEVGVEPLSFSEGAIDVMKRHSWPGNVTELANLVRRLWNELGSGVVHEADLRELGDRPSGVAFSLPSSGIVFADLERAMLTQALAMAGNNQTRAASLLGLTRDQLRYRLGKFEI